MAAPVTVLVFLNSSRTTVLATHETVVRPTVDGWAHVDLGPFLPSFRYPSGNRLGARLELGKTSATSYDELVKRYAFLAGQPDGQIAKVRAELIDMAAGAALVGGLSGLAGPALWVLVGDRRRREISASRPATATVAGAAVVVVGLVGVSIVRPWSDDETVAPVAWKPLTEALPDVPVPPEAAALQVDTGLLTRGTERLVESALSSYRTSSTFYRDAAAGVADLEDEVRAAEDGETVGVLVSDRHDNILMDPVARAVADLAGATFLLDAGDDTSTGSSWEAFSLESLDEAFDDVEDRFHVSGNHDQGGFIAGQAEDLGFTSLDGELVEGPDDIRLMGVGDPRSSGLGSWRDETGLSFDDVSERLADGACAADDDGERVSTLLVHDADLGTPALDRGCVDLVLAGHLHEIVGPEPVEGPDGQVGYSYTTGTTGGSAYAIAIGTKPRRDATVSLVTYREGRPVGVQWVTLSPLGDLEAGPWMPLDLEPVDDD